MGLRATVPEGKRSLRVTITVLSYRFRVFEKFWVKGSGVAVYID